MLAYRDGLISQVSSRDSEIPWPPKPTNRRTENNAILEEGAWVESQMEINFQFVTTVRRTVEQYNIKGKLFHFTCLNLVCHRSISSNNMRYSCYKTTYPDFFLSYKNQTRLNWVCCTVLYLYCVSSISRKNSFLHRCTVAYIFCIDYQEVPQCWSPLTYKQILVVEMD